MTAQSTWQPPPPSYRSKKCSNLHHAGHGHAGSSPSTSAKIFFASDALEMDWDIGVVIYEPQDAKQHPERPRRQESRRVLAPRRRVRFQIRRPHRAHAAVEVRHQSRYHDLSRTILFSRCRIAIGPATWKMPTARRARRSGPKRRESPRTSTRSSRTRRSAKITARWCRLPPRKARNFFIAWRPGRWLSKKRSRKPPGASFPTSEFSIYIHGHSTGGPVRHDGVAARGEYRRPGRLRQLAFRLDVSA